MDLFSKETSEPLEGMVSPDGNKKGNFIYYEAPPCLSILC